MHTQREQTPGSDVPVSTRRKSAREATGCVDGMHRRSSSVQTALPCPCRSLALRVPTVPQATDILRFSPIPLSHQSSRRRSPAEGCWPQCRGGGGAGHGVAPSKSSRLGRRDLCCECDSAEGRRARPLWENEGRPLLALKDRPRDGGRGEDAGPRRGRGGGAGTRGSGRWVGAGARAAPGGRHQPASGAGQ